MAKVLFCKGNYILAQGSRGKRKGGNVFFNARFAGETQRWGKYFLTQGSRGKRKAGFFY
jgi:hypothetical protein